MTSVPRDPSTRVARPAGRRWIAAASIGGALLLCLSLAGHALVLSRPVPIPDVIVSLASHEWERLPLTAQLAVKHPGALVLLTQPDVVTATNCYECGSRIERLVTLGVASNRIRVLQLTRGGTLGEAEASRKFILGGSPRGQLLVVSSPYHTRRAFAVFRHVLAGTGVEVGVTPATQFSDAQPEFWWAKPYDRWYVAYEWAATVYYAVRHGILPAIDEDVGASQIETPEALRDQGRSSS